MSTLLKVTLIIIAVLVVLFIVLYIVARKAEKKSAEQREAMESNAQTMSFYVIDKKKIKLKDANLPKIVTDQTPKYLRGAKMPILKVKVGPKVMSLICDEQVYNNADSAVPLAPSDTVVRFVDFLEKNRERFGFARNVFIDNADQATITELNKYKRERGCAYIFNNAWKKMKIIDRINLQLGWFATDKVLILEHCGNYISELELYSWQEEKDNEPEDGHDHMINSVQYAFLPFVSQIGVNKK